MSDFSNPNSYLGAEPETFGEPCTKRWYPQQDTNLRLIRVRKFTVHDERLSERDTPRESLDASAWQTRLYSHQTDVKVNQPENLKIRKPFTQWGQRKAWVSAWESADSCLNPISEVAQKPESKDSVSTNLRSSHLNPKCATSKVNERTETSMMIKQLQRHDFRLLPNPFLWARAETVRLVSSYLLVRQGLVRQMKPERNEV